MFTPFTRRGAPTARPAAVLAVCGLIFAALGSAPARAQEPAVDFAAKAAVDLLPENTAVYVEVARPKQLLASVLEHALAKKLQGWEEVQQVLESAEYNQFRFIVSLVEAQLGVTWREAVETIGGEGFYAALHAETQGVALLLKTSDSAKRDEILRGFVKLARDDAQRKGQGDPLKKGEYRGVKAFRLGDARFAMIGPWLVVANKDEIGKLVLDQALDKDPSTLAKNVHYQKALAARSAGQGQKREAAAWAFVNVEALRQADKEGKLSQDKSDNPVGELLIGGLAQALRQADFATAALEVDDAHLALKLAMPHKYVAEGRAAPYGEPRAYFFGFKEEGRAPRGLAPKETIASLAGYRELDRFWLAKGDLFTENVAAELDKAEGQLSTLFSGLHFGQDVLGAVRPELQLVVTRQRYEGLETPAPDIKLPAFALVCRLKNPDQVQRQFRVTFQSLIGFLNVAGAQQGNPPLEVNNEKVGDAQVVSAVYPPVGKKQGDAAAEGKLYYNFSPTIAFAKDWFFVSSTRGLAVELSELAALEQDGAPSARHTHGHVDAATLGAALQDNQAQLVAQNMLEKGHSKEKAQREVAILLKALTLARDLKLEVRSQGDSLELTTRLDFATD